MEPTIEFEKEETYCCVFTHQEDTLDISIFEEKEWNNLLEICEVFDQHARFISSYSDYGYSKLPEEYRRAAYYFRYTNYFGLWFESLTDLEYQMDLTTHEILEQIVSKGNKGNLITINKTRKWLSEHYDEIQQKLKVLNDY